MINDKARGSNAGIQEEDNPNKKRFKFLVKRSKSIIHRMKGTPGIRRNGIELGRDQMIEIMGVYHKQNVIKKEVK